MSTSAFHARNAVHQITHNIVWLVADKVIRLLGTLGVGIYLARYLGPERFGVFNYATAFVAIFAAIGGLGLQTLVVRELVIERGEKTSTLVTAFYVQLAASVLAALAAVIAARTLEREIDETFVGIVILSTTIIFRSSEIVRYWFEAAVAARKTLVTEIVIFGQFLALKIACIAFHKGLTLFFLITAGESLTVALAFLYIYKKNISPSVLNQFNTQRARDLLIEAWPLVISGLSIMLYMRIDQIMIGHFLTNRDVGIYSAATRISEAWYFVPIAIVTSVFPSLLEARKRDVGEYYQKLQRVASFLVILAYVVAVPVTLFSDQIIRIVYGPAYLSSGSVLAIYIWGGVFVSVTTLSGKWFVAEGLVRYAAGRSVAGAVLNVVLNYFAIPAFGLVGSAVATVISFAVANFLIFALSRRCRQLFNVLLASFFLTSARSITVSAIRSLTKNEK